MCPYDWMEILSSDCLLRLFPQKVFVVLRQACDFVFLCFARVVSLGFLHVLLLLVLRDPIRLPLMPRSFDNFL
jgi:hypothetical protein